MLQPAEHDLDPIATFVAALVAFYRFLALFPASDASAYPFDSQRFPEPISVISSVSEQPFDIRQAAQQGSGADVVADLPCRNEQVERTSPAVADGVQLGIHAALGSANQAATPPF